MKLLLAFALLASVSRAGEVCHSTTYPAALTNWTQTFTLPKHDPALGTLQSVVVTVRCVMIGGVGAENPSPIAAVYTSHLAVLGTISRPDTSSILNVEPSVDSVLRFGPFDGTLDLRGTSGVSLGTFQVDSERHVVLSSPADLALFTAASSGEAVGLGVRVSGVSTAVGPGPLAVLFSTTAAVDVSVCYGYREACQSDSTPVLPTNWQQTRVFAKHDPTSGPLRSVRVRARTRLTGTAQCENPLPPVLPTTSQLACMTRIERPDGSAMLSFETMQRFADPLAGYDGVIDFGGFSGVSHTSIAVETAGSSILTAATDLALFTAASAGETIALGVRASGSSSATSNGPLITLFSSSAEIELDVCYDYSAPVVPYCFGDGSSAACPCGNASAVGAMQGCLNSLGIGAELRSTGFAEIGADTAVLTASNLPATTTVLFFQGTSATSSIFGDGLRCASGTVRRLGIRTASSGVAAFPPIGTTLSSAGSATIGSVLRYQAWYRNAVAFCTPSVFNLTNGLAIAW